MSLLIGVAGFVFLYIYEVNQIVWHRNFIKYFFATGFFCILAATFIEVLSSWNQIGTFNNSIIVGIITFVIMLFLLIYTLFYSIPFSESYIEQFNKREVYSEKMYALSRHPGVLWFTGVYLGIVLIIPTSPMITLSITMVLLNVLYIIIQDAWSFPKLFVDYNQYKESTPFLLPSPKSFIKSIKSYLGRK